MSDGKEAQLARIRDNQRRSRARRKEYLQELESKLRNCEQLGVEASAEIQAAARKVLDENKRLRALLTQKGVSEGEIEAFTASLRDNSSRESPSNALLNLLGSKKQCDGSSCCTSGKPSSRGGSSSQDPAHQSLIGGQSELLPSHHKDIAMAGFDQGAQSNDNSLPFDYSFFDQSASASPGKAPYHLMFAEGNSATYGEQMNANGYTTNMRPDSSGGFEMVGTCCQGPTIDCAIGNNMGFNITPRDF